MAARERVLPEGAIGVLDHFLAFPEGLDTEVRERGSRLSAGERQLVALARAALVDPAVLVLDEATSNLDPGTEAEVEHALESLMLDRTVIVVAHRLSTVRRADRIAVVDAGGLAELGTHDELVERLSAAYESLPIGSPLEPATLVGPLIDDRAAGAFDAAIREAVDDGGALVIGGQRELVDGDGCYVRPAIVTMPAQTEIVKAETFAPLLYVLAYDNFDEAIRWAIGLPDAVWGENGRP